MKFLSTFLITVFLWSLTAGSTLANNFDSRELLFDTMIHGLADKDLTDEEKEEIETKVEQWVDDLSADQVHAFNQFLNDMRHNQFRVDFTDPENWELLDLALENDYNRKQITALTKALESEARFLAHYERTGKEHFLHKAEREKQKFLGKIDRFDDTAMESEMKTEMHALMKDMAKEARMEAKNTAKQEFKTEAKQQAKNEIRSAAQDARNENRGGGGKAKGKNKTK